MSLLGKAKKYTSPICNLYQLLKGILQWKKSQFTFSDYKRFASVRGVKNTSAKSTKFTDDEFVVYNTAQIVIKYVVEYDIYPNIPRVSSLTPSSNIIMEEKQPTIPSSTITNTTISIGDLVQAKVKTEKQMGLLTSGGKSLPLKSVYVKAKILDLASEVVVFQNFRNEEGNLATLFYFISFSKCF